MRAPVQASYVAVLLDATERAAELAHLARFCEQHGLPSPAASATHFRAQLASGLRLKWERHGEFSGYTLIAPGVADAGFATTAAQACGADWLRQIPGATIAAVHAELRPQSAGEATAAELMAQAFEGQAASGADIAEGAARVVTDFQLHAGCTRFLVFDRGLTERQSGRVLQRLFEIEAYRMLALLALPIARRQSPRLLEIETALGTLTGGIARGNPVAAGRGADDDEKLLQELTRLAAEVESGLAASQFRFGACRAYHELVLRRIAELREQRIPGMQTMEEFMARRLTPAVATCATVSQRLHDLSERVSQASNLLSTRVDIERERQNQALLASMDRRAKLQLRLQQTVEGLSVAAICYYAAGLVGYLAKAVGSTGVRVNSDLIVGLAIPVVAVVVLLGMRRVRRSLIRGDQ